MPVWSPRLSNSRRTPQTRQPRRRIQPPQKRVRALLLRSLFWMVCLASAQNHRSASRSALPVAPSINCEQRKGAYVFAVDLPTGLDTDSGKADRDCVVADFTVTIGYAKPGLVADGALNYVGRIEVVPLDELRPPETKPKEIIASPAAFRGLLPRRKYNSYKNQFGRIGVVAGSKGFVGAALMASQGALRAGAGLVEVFVPEEIYDIVAGAAFMEAMVKPVASYRQLLKEKADVWAVGPGLGKSRAAEILELVEKVKQPMVLDADGLNIVSEKTSVLRRCKGKRLLTPHPGEMKRLFPEEPTVARQNSDEIL